MLQKADYAKRNASIMGLSLQTIYITYTIINVYIRLSIYLYTALYRLLFMVCLQEPRRAFFFVFLFIIRNKYYIPGYLVYV